MRFTVVIPIFNEQKLLPQLFERLINSPLPTVASGTAERRIVLIDDASTDGTRAIAESLCDRDDTVLICHEQNKGKGGAVRTGIEAALASGAETVLIQDADLEYDPADHPALLAPIVDGSADVVIGSRFSGSGRDSLTSRQVLGNRVITMASNLCNGLGLSDIECCSKVFRREVLEQITIRENRFGLEPELVAKAARAIVTLDDGVRQRARIVEVPVGYDARSYAEGKKITWRDGISALRCVVRYNLLPGTA